MKSLLKNIERTMKNSHHEQKYAINQESFNKKSVNKQFEKRDVSVEYTLKTRRYIIKRNICMLRIKKTK